MGTSLPSGALEVVVIVLMMVALLVSAFNLVVILEQPPGHDKKAPDERRMLRVVVGTSLVLMTVSFVVPMWFFGIDLGESFLAREPNPLGALVISVMLVIIIWVSARLHRLVYHLTRPESPDHRPD